METLLVLFAAGILLVSWLIMGSLLALITKAISAFEISIAMQRMLFIAIGTPFLAPSFMPSFLPVPVPVALMLLITLDIDLLVAQWKFVAWSALGTGILLAVASGWAVRAVNAEHSDSGRVLRG